MADDKGSSNVSLGMAAGDMLSGAAMGIGGGLVGDIIGALDIGGNRRRRKQIEQQQKLTDMQMAANKEMANYGMGISKEMFEATGYGAQRRQMEEAGLNPALMYGHAGAGGQTASSGAGSAGMGQASDEASQKMASAQQQGMALQMAKVQSEVEINKAQAKKLDAEASNLDEKSITEIESRDMFVEKMKQEGLSWWFDNVESSYKHTVIQDDVMKLYGNDVYGVTTALQGMSAFSKEVTSVIANTQAETGNQAAQALLNNEKYLYYYDELLNAIKHANADEVKANAIKLSAEWSTGEMTNWKTWVDLGVDAVNMISGIVGTGAKLKGAKAIASRPSR